MNKHGWGLRVELAFLLLFLVCLIIASVGLSQFGLLTQEQEYSSPSESYYVLENEISTAAKKYYKKQYNEDNGSFTYEEVHLSVGDVLEGQFLYELKEDQVYINAEFLRKELVQL